MTAETFFQLFNQYGLILVCAVVFCEYMNLPGFPASPDRLSASAAGR